MKTIMLLGLMALTMCAQAQNSDKFLREQAAYIQAGSNLALRLLSQSGIKENFKSVNSLTKNDIDPQYFQALNAKEWKRVEKTSLSHDMVSMYESSRARKNQAGRAVHFAYETKYLLTQGQAKALYEMSIIPIQGGSYFVVTTVDAMIGNTEVNDTIFKTDLIEK